MLDPRKITHKPERSVLQNSRAYYMVIRPYIWTVLWALFVLVLCLLPPKELDGLTPVFEGADKLVHTGFFFVFSVLLFHAMTRRRLGKFGMLWRVVLISLLFALFTEFLQWQFFTYRSAEIWDLIANFVGIGMGSFAFVLLHKPH